MNTVKIKPWIIIISYSAAMVLLILNFNAVIGNFHGLMTILTPFIVGYIFAFVLNRPYMMMENKVVTPLLEKIGVKKSGIAKGISIVLIYVLLFMFLSGVVSFVLPQLVTSIMDFTAILPAQLDRFGQEISKFIVKYNVEAEVLDFYNKYWTQLLTAFSNMLATMIPAIADTALRITTGITNLFVGVVVSIYLLLSKEKLINQAKKILYAFVPQERADYVKHVGGVTNKTFGGFLTGQIIVSLIVGVLCFVGMTLFKMPYALLASVVVCVTNVIPYFGPIIGAVPGTLIILITEPVKALGFVLLIVVIQQFDGNFMSPKIVGSSIGLSGVWVLFSILVGGGLFGIMGMVIGLPGFAVFYTLLRESTHARLKAKGKNFASPEA